MSEAGRSEAGGRIVQFGTSRFLQAHVDLFAHEAREAGQTVAPITIVKTTPGGPRDHRVAAFARGQGFPVMLRGLIDGANVERTVQVRSVDRALAAHSQWPELLRLFAEDASFVVSNTGDNGYDEHDDDSCLPREGEAPAAFPAKLLVLLQARHRAGGRPLTILPCELITGNGQALRRALVRQADRWRLPEAFRRWLADKVIIADTLVDRIVSAPIEPIGAVAEPYGLWAIQRTPGLTLPFDHPELVVTDDLEPYARLKLHILNLGHTYLAELWREARWPVDVTVKTMLGDDQMSQRLCTVYADEVLPGFAARGLGNAAHAYVATTWERLANPFLHHRVSDIWQNHDAKVDRRIREFLDWTDRWDESPTLRRVVARTSRLSDRHSQRAP